MENEMTAEVEELKESGTPDPILQIRKLDRIETTGPLPSGGGND